MSKRKKDKVSCKDCKWLLLNPDSMFYCEVYHGMLDSAEMGCCFFEAKEKNEDRAN